MNNYSQNKVDYKNTKFGFIPDNWRVVRISDGFSFLSTTSYSRNDVHYENTPESIFYIHYGDIHSTFKKSILDFEKEENIPVLIPSIVKNGDTTFLQNGDLIIVDASEDYEGIGTCIEIRNIGNRKVISGLHTIAIRDIENNTASGFRPYIFKNRHISLALKTIATGSKVYGISKTNLSKLEIILPPIDEQQKIARILSAYDRAIETTEKLINKKQRRKKGLMQQLLTGESRFTEFVNSYKLGKTKLGSIPKNWEYVEFGNIVELSKEKYNPSNNVYDFKCIELANIDQETGKINGYINSSIQKSIKNRFYKGDVLFGKLRPYLKKYWLAEFDGVCTTEIWVLKAKTKYCINKYLIYLIQQQKFIEATNRTTGTKMPRADWNYLIELPFLIPPLAEQQKIAFVLSIADNEIKILQKQLERLKVQKKGIMQVLLTGEKRVVHEQ